jgi:autonomous glycyl radical cofactor GrcA
MKHLKQFESYFDKDSLWTEWEGDFILTAFDEGRITDAKKEIETKPAYRSNGDQVETTFTFKIDSRPIFVQYIEYPNRDPHIVIRIGGYFTDISKDSEYRTEILKRCMDTIK